MAGQAERAERSRVPDAPSPAPARLQPWWRRWRREEHASRREAGRAAGGAAASPSADPRCSSRGGRRRRSRADGELEVRDDSELEVRADGDLEEERRMRHSGPGAPSPLPAPDLAAPASPPAADLELPLLSPLRPAAAAALSFLPPLPAAGAEQQQPPAGPAPRPFQSSASATRHLEEKRGRHNFPVLQGTDKGSSVVGLIFYASRFQLKDGMLLI
jgi:hypothetical protein